MNMKREVKRKILMVILALAIFIITGCSKSESSDTSDNKDIITWKMGAVDPESYYMTALTIKWGDKIEERSNGRIQCEMYASGQLGSDISMMESLDAGSLQIWEGGSNVVNMFNPAFDAWGLLYLYESQEQKYNFWDTHFEEVADKLADETGYRPLAVIDGPYRELTSTTPIENMDDLKGYKIRVPEINTYIDSWKAVGAAPTAMSFSEVYTSLQTKVISGQENDVLLSESSGFFDVCKYLVMTDHSAYEGFIIIPEKQWKELPDDLKEIVKECSKELMSESREVVNELVDDCMKQLEEKGVIVTYPDTTKFRESVQPVYDNYPHVQDIVKLIRQS